MILVETMLASSLFVGCAAIAVAVGTAGAKLVHAFGWLSLLDALARLLDQACLLGRAEHVAVALLRAPRAAAELASHVAVELRELALPDRGTSRPRRAGRSILIEYHK